MHPLYSSTFKDIYYCTITPIEIIKGLTDKEQFQFQYVTKLKRGLTCKQHKFFH